MTDLEALAQDLEEKATDAERASEGYDAYSPGAYSHYRVSNAYLDAAQMVRERMAKDKEAE